MHGYAPDHYDCGLPGKVPHPVHFEVAKKAADCLDNHEAGLIALAPATQELALRSLRKFIFSNLGSPEAQRLAELSWVAADTMEKILDESADLFGASL